MVQGFKPQWTLIKERLRNVLTCYRPCSTGWRLARPQDISTVAKNLHHNIYSPAESHRYTYLLSDIGTMPCYKRFCNTVELLHAIVGQKLEPTTTMETNVRHVRWYIYLVADSWRPHDSSQIGIQFKHRIVVKKDRHGTPNVGHAGNITCLCGGR